MPKTPARIVCSFGVSGSWNAAMTKGISEMWVTPCFCTTGQKPEVDHFGVSTAVAPTPSTDHSVHDCALTWKNGR
jgi:hypothetical protein